MEIRRNNSFIIIGGELYVLSELEFQEIRVKLADFPDYLRFKEFKFNENVAFLQIIMQSNRSIEDITSIFKFSLFGESELRTKSYIAKRLRDKELFNLQSDPVVQNLILKGNGIKNLSIIVEKFPNIVSLDISNNLITDFHQLIELITNHKKIKHIIFIGNPIGSVFSKARFEVNEQMIDGSFHECVAEDPNNEGMQESEFCDLNKTNFDSFLFDTICEKFDSFLEKENILEIIDKRINKNFGEETEDIFNVVKSLIKCCQSRYMNHRVKLNSFYELINAIFGLISTNINKLETSGRDMKLKYDSNRNIEVMKMNIHILEESLHNKENQINSLRNYVEVLTKINGSPRQQMMQIGDSSRSDGLYRHC